LSSSCSAKCLFRGLRRSGPSAVPLLASASPGVLRPKAAGHVARRFVRVRSRPEGRGDVLASVAAFIGPVVSHPVHLTLPSRLGSQPTTRQTVRVLLTCDRRSAERYLQRASIRRGKSPTRSSGSLVLGSTRRRALGSRGREDRPRRSASHVACFPSAILRRRCVCPALPAFGPVAASTFTHGRGRRPRLASRHGRIPAIMQARRSFVLAVFRLALQASFALRCRRWRFGVSRNRVHRLSLEASDQRAVETFATGNGSLDLAFQSRLVRSFAAWPGWRALPDWPASRHRSWDLALRSFAPAGQFRPRRPRRRPTCRSPDPKRPD